MRETWHSFIRKITGKELLTQKAKLRYLVIAVLGVHIVLLGLNLYSLVFPMVVYNIVTIPFYSCMYNNVRKDRYLMTYLMCFGEILVQIVLGTLMVGWQAGFVMYIFAIVTVSYYMLMAVSDMRKKLYIPPLVTIASFVAYLALYMYASDHEPYFSLSEGAVQAFYVFNAFVVFVFLGALSYCFLLEIINSQNVLTVQNQNLEHMAGVDPLTGLLNRRCMEDYLEEAMAKAKQKGNLFSLIMGDIDNFKKINDTYGHDCGDQALVHVAEIMKQCVRDGDAICRWGGEEFLILVQGNLGTASVVGERIRATVEEERITYHEQEIPFTITFGISTYVPGYRMEKLIQKADERLYVGKQSGKNMVVTE